MKILHHSDIDGHCAAAVVLSKHPEAECFEVNYNRPIPFDQIQPGEQVWIVDFSLEHDGDWERLWAITKNVIWIDHHESAIMKADGVVLAVVNGKAITPLNFSGIRATNNCGAWLTWLYTMRNTPPKVLELVDRWDRWVHNDDPEVVDFVAGAPLFDLGPTGTVWTTLFTNGVLSDASIREIQIAGETINRYQAQQNAKAVQNYAFPMEWEDNDCAVLFCSRSGSKLFDSLKFDSGLLGRASVWIAVNFDGKKYTVHLYSDTIKVNSIAEKYGGGGHAGAAGFVCTELPWIQGGAA